MTGEQDDVRDEAAADGPEGAAMNVPGAVEDSGEADSAVADGSGPGTDTDTDTDTAAAKASLTKQSGKPVPRTKSARSGTARRTEPENVIPEDEGPSARPAAVPESAEPAPTGGGKQISITLSARALWRSLLALVVVAAIVGVAVLGWFFYRDQQRLNAFDDAKNASAIFAEKLTSSMNADTVANMKDIVGPLTTGEYRKHLESQLGDTTKAIQSINVKNTKIDVQKVSVIDFGTDHASTMAVVQVTGTSTLAPQGGTSLFMYSLKLDKVDGKWLVSDLDAMQAGLSDAGEAGAGGGSTPNAGPANTPVPTPAPAPAPGG
ncbi:hypothetical protein [Gordonia polyisoprenivorans]|uniref:hypothetical protein n=1 Tax=Gordonia polyisoprenivorans TaxID=84595 RepID=UPI001AD7D186|nr:hypothetical protein [Gordonia polyisoprenivorans]QTI67537.1 hypothetical protein J6U32_18335 [Gordonia polyisoprenivorans]